jgi:hypothetical protein
MSKRKSSGVALTIILSPVPFSSVGSYEARLDGDDRILCISRTPFFDAARKLAAEGHDCDTTLFLRHADSDTDSLRANLGTAASLTVEETKYGPRLRRWKPISTLAVAPKIAPNEQAATTLAHQAATTLAHQSPEARDWKSQV